MSWLPAFLRKLADAVESGTVECADVEQALFARDTYTVDCPVLEAENDTRDETVRELVSLMSSSEYTP